MRLLIGLALTFAALISAAPSHATEPAQAILPIRVNIVQCGTQAQAILHCKNDDQRCCVFADRAITTASNDIENLIGYQNLKVRTHFPKTKYGALDLE